MGKAWPVGFAAGDREPEAAGKHDVAEMGEGRREDGGSEEASEQIVVAEGRGEE